MAGDDLNDWARRAPVEPLRARREGGVRGEPAGAYSGPRDEGMAMRGIAEEAHALQDRIVADRRWLHRHPEIGFDLVETAAYVRSRLEEMGYEVAEPCPGGLVAHVGRADGPCVLLRADMDALPLAEETGLPFASANGNMHACGHDTHAAMLLGAAQILKRHEDELTGCVTLMFQPDEEGDPAADITGGQAMVEAGALDGPRVDAAVALHVNAPTYPAGGIYTRCGTMCSSIDDIDITVRGRGAHGSRPQEGVDPIAIACHIFLAIEGYVAREVDPNDLCVATFGSIQAGQAANVIPETAHMLGTLRTQDPAVRARFHERVPELAAGIARAFGGEAEVRFPRSVPVTVNDPALTRELCGYAEELFGEPVGEIPHPNMGNDDLAFVAERVPTTYFYLGATVPDAGGYGMHNPHVQFDDSVLWRGTALLANSAIEYLAHRA